MKFVSERVELPTEDFGTTEKNEPLFIVIPKGIKEGVVKRIREIGRLPEDKDARLSNAEILRLVLEWNFDDETGKPLPLMSTLLPAGKSLADVGEAKRKEAEHVIAECPAQLFGWLARKLVNRPAFTEQAEGFSKTSSET